MRPHQRKQNHISNGFRAGEQHGQAVDADAFAARGWQAVGEGADVVLVHLVGFVVAVGALGKLLLEAFVLFDRVVQLAEGVAQLETAGEELEALDVLGVVGFGLRERRDDGRVVVDDGGLDQEGLDDRLEKVIDRLAERCALE